VRRVLHRLIDEGDVPDAALRALAARLVPAARPGDFNQAFMELGSTLCSPRAPSCGGCALARLCRANAKGTQLERPTPRRASPVPDFDVGTAIVTADGHVLVRRRPEHGLLAGMWEFPGEIVGRRDSARRAARRAAARHGVLLDRRAGELLAALPHLFSHRREIYHAYGFDLAGPVKQPEAGAIWVTRVELADLPMPAAQRRIAWFALPSDPATG
jgi:A/G-specific adenine glycosylase